MMIFVLLYEYLGCVFKISVTIYICTKYRSRRYFSISNNIEYKKYYKNRFKMLSIDARNIGRNDTKGTWRVGTRISHEIDKIRGTWKANYKYIFYKYFINKFVNRNSRPDSLSRLVLHPSRIHEKYRGISSVGYVVKIIINERSIFVYFYQMCRMGCKNQCKRHIGLRTSTSNL